jgi:hypothetical protein
MKLPPKRKATPSNDHSFPFALRWRSASAWMAYVVFCSGAVVAHKLLGGFAEARGLSRRRSCRPRASRPVSFSRRRSTAAEPALKSSFPLHHPSAPNAPCGETLIVPCGARHPRGCPGYNSRPNSKALRERSGELRKFASHFPFAVRLIESPNRAAFLRIAAGDRSSCSTRASRVFVFASSIRSRSDFIEFQPRSDGLSGMLGSRLRLQPSLTRQPVRFEAFMDFLKFRFGLAVRYRLPRRSRIDSPSIRFVCDLLLGGSLRFDHSAFTFSPSSTSVAPPLGMAWKGNQRLPDWWASSCSIGPRNISAKKMMPIESTIASATANTVGTTNSTLRTLRIVATSLFCPETGDHVPPSRGIENWTRQSAPKGNVF